jgi:carbonic anhydrase
MSPKKLAITPEQMMASNHIEWVNKNPTTIFEDLALNQNPQILWIGCCDSRVPEECIKQLPGSVFVHRNIGNIVNNKTLAVIQYAAQKLNVEHVFVVGTSL